MKLSNKRIIIVGAGASGLYCAFLLARHGKRVSVFDSGDCPGRKLAISGGSHANFSNRYISPDNYFCSSSEFCEAALKKCSWKHIVRQMEEWSLTWLEKTHGRLFLKERASRLVQILYKKCQSLGVEFNFGRTVRKIDPQSSTVFFADASVGGETIVLAQGSPAAGKVAGSGCMENLSVKTGHAFHRFVPALVPLLYADNSVEAEVFSNLSGISLEVEVSLHSASISRSWKDSMLFTHSGLSGPVILNASLFRDPQSIIHVNFLPESNFEKILDENPKQKPRSSLKRLLPARLADALLDGNLSGRKNGQLSRMQRKTLAGSIHCRQFAGLRLAAAKYAEVCSGGVSVEDIHPGTMQSKLWPNLYLIGEMLDVTGELGGYNLHWAWASALSAASSILGYDLAGNDS